ncbi:MAG: IclR family transcriptional regulator [Sphingomonadaceae bacterium]
MNKTGFDTSRALDRALSLLELVSRSDSPIGTRELARSLEYPLTATHRILTTLEAHGFVRKDAQSEGYVLGTKILELGARFLERLDFRRVAYPVMCDVRDRCDETVDLFVADGAERVCVESVQSRQGVRSVVSIGTRIPIYAGAAGKVLLAHLPAEQLETVLASGLQEITHNTIADPIALRRELDLVKAQGWARSVGEAVAGNACVAAPIWGGMPPRLLAALSVAVPVTRFTPDREQSLVESVREAASRISSLLGAAGLLTETASRGPNGRS